MNLSLELHFTAKVTSENSIEIINLWLENSKEFAFIDMTKVEKSEIEYIKEEICIEIDENTKEFIDTDVVYTDYIDIEIDSDYEVTRFYKGYAGTYWQPPESSEAEFDLYWCGYEIPYFAYENRRDNIHDIIVKNHVDDMISREYHDRMEHKNEKNDGHTNNKVVLY